MATRKCSSGRLWVRLGTNRTAFRLFWVQRGCCFRMRGRKVRTPFQFVHSLEVWKRDDHSSRPGTFYLTTDMNVTDSHFVSRNVLVPFYSPYTMSHRSPQETSRKLFGCSITSHPNRSLTSVTPNRRSRFSLLGSAFSLVSGSCT